MKQFFTFLMVVAMLSSLTACGGSTGAAVSQDASSYPPFSASGSLTAPGSSGMGSSGADEQQPLLVSEPDHAPASEPGVSDAQSEQDVQTAPPQAETAEESGKILIAYFTWADNTAVENPAAIDVDATNSASVLVPGNTAKLAAWLQQETRGDLFQILVEEPYSSDYDECLDRAAEEKAQNARPALTRHLDNMETYDVVFLGYPNWWYSCPMALLTFLEEYDFSGKTVIPFCAHGTGGLASSVQDISAAIPDATMLEAFGVYRPNVDGCREDSLEWARGLGVAY